jgi:hypothetical protein
MILAVRITRQGWEEALSQAVLASPDLRVYPLDPAIAQRIGIK